MICRPIFIKAGDRRYNDKFIRLIRWPKEEMMFVKKITSNQIHGFIFKEKKLISHLTHILWFIPWSQSVGKECPAFELILTQE